MQQKTVLYPMRLFTFPFGPFNNSDILRERENTELLEMKSETDRIMEKEHLIFSISDVIVHS